ncbi:FAD binding domain-containing protein [Coprinopsis cinerea AmutBmut pab1-1]|nr:FAD binding domain-containing protein [Coprinopsis cinerea AmutBmut pab1-1]
MSSTDSSPSALKLSTQDLYRLLEPITVPSHSPRARFTNWGLSFTCKPLAVFEPENDYQCELILELARREGKVLRAVGVGHSPSDLACTNGFMLRATKMNHILEVNVEKRYVIAQAGITLNDLHRELAKNNLAMSNVGSISEQTLAGVITTGTHGSGIEYKVLSDSVLALTLLVADGSRVTCSRNENADLFIATLCGLGSTGVILSIQFEVEPAYRLKEEQESVPFDEFVSNMDTLVHSAEHARFWWFPTSDTVRCSYSNRTSEPRNPAGSWLWHSFLGHHVVQLLLFVARFFTFLNPLIANFACWLVSEKTVGVDDSHRIFNVDCRYPQHTTEWAIPLKHSQACLRELRAWLEQEHADPHGIRPHFPIEIRVSASDDIWLSPSNGQQTCWIGIVQYRQVPLLRYHTIFLSKM